MSLNFSAWIPPSIAIRNTTDRFPVRRIYTIGRNYVDHAAETGLGRNGSSVPGISLKPSDSLIGNKDTLIYPPATQQLDPEVEMVIAIGKAGKNINPGNALEYIFGYAVGLDMIRRDIMHECIANEHSWDLCKSFSGASPVGDIASVANIGHPVEGEISLKVNGEIRQSGDIASQIWNPAKIVSKLSGYCTLEPGDIVFTGTPKGPGPVNRGDLLEGSVAGVGSICIRIS
ncbi:MAG: fumarylacetoacetate hydrolase family protein [Pseudomonadota bacterium]|nr:fumarylacetoacetate hydrolase family protein [Pseudomonadota bacterium]